MAEAQRGFAEAVAFDLDGTLVDSAPDLHAAIAAALIDCRCPPPELAEVRTWIGDGTRALVAKALAARGGEAPPSYETLLARFDIHYCTGNGRLATVLPGARECLGVMAAYGIPALVVSNKEGAFARTLLRAVGLADAFVFCVFGDSLPGRRKPDPVPLQHALQKVGVAPRRALFVGDSAIDVATARAAGVPVWVLRGGYGPDTDADRLGADRVISELGEVVHALAIAGGCAASPPAATPSTCL